MVTKYESFLTDEERVATEEKTFRLVAEIISLLKDNVSVLEIASKYSISAQQVEVIRARL